MEPTQRDVFQGIVYYYRENTVLCRYRLVLNDPVDPALLQQAVDAARPLAGYFFQKVVWEKREAHLEPNDAPCLVRQTDVQPRIPEETNDYQFAFGCKGRELYIDWYHFLADGRGGSRLLTLVLKLYCNLRYGTAFVCEPQKNDPPYDVEALLARYPESQVENDMQKPVTQTSDAAPALVRVKLDKKSLVDAALALGIKPFSALVAIFCEAGRTYFGRDELVYNYSTDVRDALEAPNALFNCVASFQRSVTVKETDRLVDLAPGVDADIKQNLTKDRKRFRLAEQMGWVYQVYRQRAALKIKKRVFQMGEYISGFPSDFWVSYQGDPILPADPALEAYIQEFETWVPADGASMGVECITLHDVITICIANKTGRTGYAEALRAAFEKEGVTVLEAAELGPSPYTSPYIP